MACAADVGCFFLYPCLLLLYLHGLKTRAKLYAKWENIYMDNHQWWLSQAYTCAFHISMHIHITFMAYHLYIPIACQSFPLYVLCLWHNSYLYFSCISVSILCIFHIHSITYCSMSLAYLLSILSYLKYFHITYLILSYTFIYILILFI